MQRSGTKDAFDIITFVLPAAHTLTGITTHFFRDGSDIYAQSLRVQVRDGSGGWVDASTETVVPTGTTDAPVVHVGFIPTKTDAVRVVLTAKLDTHITISEIEILALAPGRSSDPG